ncbi:MAG: FAD-dependent oxidoreductase [Deltaproteobacteria bacterium]|nr:FAD-dependent oxidoreductase [Deltaproteobacteria bacterium]
MTINNRFDVAIIGGGVVGCCIARELSRFRLRAVLLEQHEEVGFGTSKTNSGIIHPGHHSSAATLKGRLVVRGNALFDELERELKFGFRRVGELVVARDQREIRVLEELKARGDGKGVPGLEIWKQERLLREEPNLSSKLVAALYAPTAGVINPYEFVFALMENARANGVLLRVNSPVIAIERLGDALRIQTPGESLFASFALNCAGVFADRVAALTGSAGFSIRPRKGEEYMLDKRLRGLVRRIIFPVPGRHTKGILIIPTYDGTIMVGPTAQDTHDRYDLSTTDKGGEQVFSFIREICPSITSRDTITEFAGLRAVADTDDFVIGPSACPGFINVAGIQSPGLTSAPAIAEMVRDLLQDQGLKLEARPDFQPEVPGPSRFAAMSLERQAEAIASDRHFAKVVCRCELVTEAEVNQAIDHGARTLDGIKFRTRAGMGRCQGGFCTTRCMDLLSKRLGMPMHRVTKRGGGSWIVAEMSEAQHREESD